MSSIHIEEDIPQNEIDMQILINSSYLCGQVYDMPIDVYVKLEDDIKYITIEGSDTLINWYDNASFLFRKNDIHRGFYRYARYCMEEYNLLNELNDVNVSKIVITGHSLGAACVVIVLAELCKDFNKDVVREVVLFGCPHVGGRRFMNRFQEKVLNNPDLNIKCSSLKNGEDIVCNNPPNIFGYTKSEPLIYLNPMTNENTKQKGKNGILDHMIDQYSKTLIAYQKNEKKLPPKKINDQNSKKTKKIVQTFLYAAVAYKAVKKIM